MPLVFSELFVADASTASERIGNESNQKKKGGVSSSSDPAVLPLGEMRLEGHEPIKTSLDRNGCFHHLWPSFLLRVP